MSLLLKSLLNFFLLVLLFSISVQAKAEPIKPDLFLLKSYKKHPNVTIKNWLMSEKLDGVRAYWDGHALYSRSGRKISAPQWFINALPDFELDGELWTKRGDFSHIVSIVNRQQAHKDWQEISYNIFEVPNAKGDFKQRLNKVTRYLQSHPSSFIHVIEQQLCRDNAHLEAFLSSIEQLGGEGVVIRNPKHSYYTGRTLGALKVKRFADAECKVTGYKKGKGKFKGLMGSLYCQINDGQIIRIGSGFNHEQREDPPVIGAIITYQYNGFTTTGKPRFPVFLRLRNEP